MLEKQDSGWNNNMLWVAMSHLGNIAIYTITSARSTVIAAEVAVSVREGFK